MNKCKVCGKEIERSKSFCSKKCNNYYNYSHKTTEKPCKVCGKTFTGRAKQSCCSLGCRVKSQQTHSNKCKICNKMFTGRSNQLFCSNRCYRKATDNKPHSYTSYICPVCSNRFWIKKTINDITCSAKCRRNLIKHLARGTVGKIKRRGYNWVKE